MLCLPLVLWSQSPVSNYQRMRQYSDSLHAQFSQYQSSMNADYRRFVDEINAEYAAFMRQAWQYFSASQPYKAPVVEPPRPLVDSVLPLSTQPIVPSVVRRQADEVRRPVVVPQPVVPPTPSDRRIAVSFFGTPTVIEVPDVAMPRLLSSSEDDVAQMWESLASVNLPVDAVRQVSLLHGWCQWAEVQYADSVAQALYPCHECRNERVVLSMFLVCQQGMAARIARGGDRLYRLLAVDGRVFDAQRWTVDGEDYYYLDGGEAPSSVAIFNRSFGSATKPFSLAISKPMALGDGSASLRRQLAARRYPQLAASVAVNPAYLCFYQSYPNGTTPSNERMSRWALRAEAPLSPELQSSLYPAVADALDGHGDDDRVAMLLNFVQTAFVYGYDSEVWGRDRAFFAEETCHYPYSDCEDRAILFAHLVMRFTSCPVALLLSPGHLYAAVALQGSHPGTYFDIDGVRFYLADPTLRNGNIGDRMADIDYSDVSALVLQSVINK